MQVVLFVLVLQQRFEPAECFQGLFVDTCEKGSKSSVGETKQALGDNIPYAGANQIKNRGRENMKRVSCFLE